MRNSQQTSPSNLGSKAITELDRSLIICDCASNRQTRADPYGLPRLRHFENGGGERIRTDDILLAKQALYQLSYAPAANFFRSGATVGLLNPTRSAR